MEISEEIYQMFEEYSDYEKTVSNAYANNLTVHCTETWDELL